MKMSEVFKLPLTWNRSVDESGLRIKIEISDSSDDALKGFFYNMSDDEVSAIIVAVNSHDTQLADIDRLGMACAEMYDLCDWGMMEAGTEEKYTDIIIESLIECKPAYDKMMSDIDKLMDLDPEPNSEDGKLLHHLATLIEKYELAHQTELREKYPKEEKDGLL